MVVWFNFEKDLRDNVVSHNYTTCEANLTAGVAYLKFRVRPRFIIRQKGLRVCTPHSDQEPQHLELMCAPFAFNSVHTTPKLGVPDGVIRKAVDQMQD